MRPAEGRAGRAGAGQLAVLGGFLVLFAVQALTHVRHDIVPDTDAAVYLKIAHNLLSQEIFTFSTRSSGSVC